MKERKKKPGVSLNATFDEALVRFAKAKPGELANAIAKDLSDSMKEATKRISEVREDVSRGERTKKERFRL
jgi:hypothetical protein